MANIIGSIICTPKEPYVGQSVLVEVKPVSGETFDAPIKDAVHINGVQCTRTYLQYRSAGPHTIFVQAAKAGESEVKSVVVQVKDLPVHVPPVGGGGHDIPIPETWSWDRIGTPILRMHHEPHQPHVVGISVGANTVPKTAAISGAKASPLAASPVTTGGSPHINVPPSAEPIYRWTFGDGTSVDTHAPFAQHDYSGAIDLLQYSQSFDIVVGELTGTHPVVTRTVTFSSAYAMLKKAHNRLHPDAEPEGFATRTSTGFTASFKIKNPEFQAVVLHRCRFVAVMPGKSQDLKPSSIETITPQSIPSRSTATIHVTPSFNQVPHDSLGFSVYYTGLGPLNEDLRVNVHFDVDPKQRQRPKVSLTTGPSRIVLDSIRDTLLQKKLSGATFKELQSMTATIPAFNENRAQLIYDLHLATTGMRIPGALTSSEAHVPPNAEHHSDLHPTSILPPAVPKVGDLCEPDNLPGNMPPGLACQLTNEPPVTVTTPARYINAWKGHTILAPGGVGPIGKLLTQVNPPQQYSHCGIMTRNFDQITHCTMQEERMQAYPVGSILGKPAAVAGYRVDVVKYGWPGTLTQTVDACINGGDKRPDPEQPTNKYDFSDFNAYASVAEVPNTQNQWHLIQPLVVKPDPMLEDSTLVQKLHTVADDAFAHNGKHHYRFYCYSDPTIVSDPTKAAPAGQHLWCDGTTPACCSSFIWEMMKRNDFPLTTTADSNPAVPDGLYVYTAQDRLRAATYLNGYVLQQVNDALSDAVGFLSGILDWLTKVRTHVPNELVNFFASDSGTQDDDSQSWENVKQANAVSPDNIMRWSGPSATPPGPYGYTEPCRYVDSRVDLVPVTRYVQIQQTGTIFGQVFAQGAHVAGATVWVDSQHETNSNASGYKIPNIGFGQYTLRAQKTEPDGMIFSASMPLTVNSASKEVTITLLPPPSSRRLVVIDGYIHIHYDWHGGFSSDIEDKDFHFHLEVPLNIDKTHGDTGYAASIKTASTNLAFKLYWNNNRTVDVEASFTLHSSTAHKGPINIPQDGQFKFEGNELSGNADNDQAWAICTVRNTQAPD